MKQIGLRRDFERNRNRPVALPRMMNCLFRIRTLETFDLGVFILAGWVLWRLYLSFPTVKKVKRKWSNPCTDLDRPCWFQEVEAPRFQDNRHMKVVIFQPYVQAAFTTRKYSSFPIVQNVIYSLLLVLAFIIFLVSNCQYYVREDYSDVNSIGARGGGLPGCSPSPPAKFVVTII